jgi:hypothetical protein
MQEPGSGIQHLGVDIQLVSALPSRLFPEKLSEGVGLKDEDVALVDADSSQGGKRSFDQGAADAFSPRFDCDGEMVDVAAPAVGAAEDRADELVSGYGDAAQAGVAGKKLTEEMRVVGVAQSNAFDLPPHLKRCINVAGNEFSKYKTDHAEAQRLDYAIQKKNGEGLSVCKEPLF